MKFFKYSLIISLLLFSTLSYAKVIYVDNDATGANDGSSWQNAYIYLQDALADANSFPEPAEIRIAQGTYKPDQGAGQTIGDQYATFELINDVTLSGGYAGILEPDPNEQDFDKYETFLSGDLADNDIERTNAEDLLFTWHRDDNSFYIVTNKYNSVLEGLIITNGNSNRGMGDTFIPGGGIFNDTGNLTLLNCTISWNATSFYGGGINISNSTLVMIDCIVKNNCSIFDTAGIFSDQSSLEIKNCVFENNIIWSQGKACLFNRDGDISLTNCVFENNSGQVLKNQNSKLNLLNCVFNKNSGGGLYNSNTSEQLDSFEQKIDNCIFNANSPGNVIYNQNDNLVLNNCIFSGNVGSTTIYISSTSNKNGDFFRCGAKLNNCVLYGNQTKSMGGIIFHNGKGELLINNSILWGNTAKDGNQIATNGSGYYGSVFYENILTIKNSNSQGGASGIYIDFQEEEVEWPEGNIDIDPLFVNPGYWDSNDTPEDANDDFWVQGDYHLKSQAGRWDPSIQSWIQDDVTSPCIDAGNPNSPMGLEQFPNGGYVNMGAYGGTNQASKSYFGKPVCETIVAGDINGDCKVDILDMEIMMLHWLEDNNP